MESDLQAVFQEEQALLTSFQETSGTGQFVSYPNLLLWGVTNGASFPLIRRFLKTEILVNDEMSAIVETLWGNEGNMVKTAQDLYLHRNTLQYKLDKFYQRSGLNLKHLDDLALSYLLLLEK
ncbi:Leucine rich protein [Streptococcus sp. DD13]|nr:Leucine rich protein [Streptococcus sp. DD13]